MSNILDTFRNWVKQYKTGKEASSYSSSPKQPDLKAEATARKEPYVVVLDTHVNSDNPRNGFFDLDWNDYFITMLTDNGYHGASEEEIVDKWFGDLCREIGSEENIHMDRRGAGYINVSKAHGGKAEAH